MVTVYCETLAKRLDISERTIERHIEFAKKSGFMEIIQTGRASVFILLSHPWMEIDEETARKREVALPQPNPKTKKTRAKTEQADPTKLSDQIRQNCRIGESLSLIEEEKLTREKLAGNSVEQAAVVEEAQAAVVEEAQPVAQAAVVEEAQAAVVEEAQPVAQAAVVEEAQAAVVEEAQAAVVEEAQPVVVEEAQPVAPPQSTRAATKATRKLLRALRKASSTQKPQTSVSEMPAEPNGERKTRHCWKMIWDYAVAQARTGNIENLEGFAVWLWRTGKQDTQLERWAKARAENLVGGGSAQPTDKMQPVASAASLSVNLEQIKRETEEILRLEALEALREKAFNGLTPEEQEQLISDQMDNMMASEYRKIFKRMDDDKLREQAIFLVQKELVPN